MSRELAYSLTNKNYPKWKSRHSNNCNCVEMVDIGVYNTCMHFCKYCYANFLEDTIKENMMLHNPNSSLLIGNIKENDIIKVRK